MINQVNIKFSLPENQPKQNQQQPQLQQSYTIDNYNRLSQELRNRYMGQKDELASQQFQAFPSKPTNLPVSEPNHRQSSPSFLILMTSSAVVTGTSLGRVRHILKNFKFIFVPDATAHREHFEI